MLNEIVCPDTSGKSRHAGKITKKVITTVLFLLFSISLSAQQDSVSALISQGRALSKAAYLHYNMNEMLEAQTVFEKAFDMDKSNMLPLYYITLVDYKLLEMSVRDSSILFDRYYETALKNADTLGADKDFAADGKILAAAIYMMKIATNPMSGATLSFRIHSLLDDAQKTNPEKPYSYVIRGMMNFNTPQMYGGSYKDALKNFNKAAKLFEDDENENGTDPNWGYVETLAWMGRTQEMLNNNEAAQFAYKKALSIEPEFGWVKYSLLPKLEEKLKTNK